MVDKSLWRCSRVDRIESVVLYSFGWERTYCGWSWRDETCANHFGSWRISAFACRGSIFYCFIYLCYFISGCSETLRASISPGRWPGEWTLPKILFKWLEIENLSSPQLSLILIDYRLNSFWSTWNIRKWSAQNTLWWELVFFCLLFFFFLFVCLFVFFWGGEGVYCSNVRL